MNSIGVFDSGVGGLSVLREIRQRLPRENLVYVSDSAHLPYGNKSSEFIIERAHFITRFLLEQGAKAIVVACNTATAAAIENMRAVYTVPIVGMEPAIKPAAALTKTGVIAILATVSTLKSAKYEHLHNRFGDDVLIIRQPCEGWVEQIETGDLTSKAAYELVANSVQPLMDKNVDTLVLGCTHYPFLMDIIRSITGQSVNIIETGTAVARHLQRRLEEAGGLNTAGQAGQVRFWSSSPQQHVQLTMTQLWREPVELAYLPTN